MYKWVDHYPLEVDETDCAVYTEINAYGLTACPLVVVILRASDYTWQVKALPKYLPSQYQPRLGKIASAQLVMDKGQVLAEYHACYLFPHMKGLYNAVSKL